MIQAMRRALADKERGFGKQCGWTWTQEALAAHRAVSPTATCGRALGALELAVLTTPAAADGAMSHRPGRGGGIHSESPCFDATRAYYYDMLSAFCKSLRGSDSDAALAWFARLFIRRGRSTA